MELYKRRGNIIDNKRFRNNMIKALIFDFDGVIHDTLEMAVKISRQIFPEMTLEEYKDMFDGNFYAGKKITPAIIKKFFELQKEEFKNLKIERAIKSELLKLKSEFDLFIITSNDKEILDMYFENNGIAGIFKQILGVETHHLKEEKFRLVLESNGLKKDDCVFITDTLGDLLEANKAGIKSIAVDFGFHDREKLERGNPLKIVSDFSDIRRAVQEITA